MIKRYVHKINVPHLIREVDVNRPPMEIQYGLMYKCDLVGVLDHVLRVASSHISALTGRPVTCQFTAVRNWEENPLLEIGTLTIGFAESDEPVIQAGAAAELPPGYKFMFGDPSIKLCGTEWKSAPLQIHDLKFKRHVRAWLNAKAWLRTFWANRRAWPTALGYRLLVRGMQRDREFAESWRANLQVTVRECGVDNTAALMAADRLMAHCFEVRKGATE